MGDRFAVITLCDETGQNVGGFVLHEQDVRLLLSQQGRTGVVPYEFVGLCDEGNFRRAVAMLRKVRANVDAEDAAFLGRLRSTPARYRPLTANGATVMVCESCGLTSDSGHAGNCRTRTTA